MIELNTMKFFVKFLWNTFQFLLSRSKQLIKDAILGNDFLKNLDSTQVREIVDCMYEKRIKQGNYIIREGDAGQHVYVSAGKYPDVNRHRCKNALTIRTTKQKHYKISHKHTISVVSWTRTIIFGKHKQTNLKIKNTY